MIASLLAGAGCADVAGGAVDLSWTLRTTDGDDTTCSGSRVTVMRLWWEHAGEEGSAAWPCENVRAITDFEVPAGPALLWVTPECADGPAAAGTFVAPPPLSRTIETGEVIGLGAVVVQVQRTRCDEQPCICS
ncbi:MAG: hypothetical protein R2939_14585 [Kofleriaceae bacterium]